MTWVTLLYRDRGFPAIARISGLRHRPIPR
jgi:hypothetical protein